MGLDELKSDGSFIEVPPSDSFVGKYLRKLGVCGKNVDGIGKELCNGAGGCTALEVSTGIYVILPTVVGPKLVTLGVGFVVVVDGEVVADCCAAANVATPRNTAGAQIHLMATSPASLPRGGDDSVVPDAVNRNRAWRQS